MLGIMLTTMFLSMWISNTASTAMMIPIVEAMVEEIKNCRIDSGRDESSSNQKNPPVFVTQTSQCSSATLEATDGKESAKEMAKNWTQCPKLVKTVRQTLLLSVAYAANCGGTGTLTGTGTNLILQGLVEE